MIHIGIDPGQSGGIAWIADLADCVYSAKPLKNMTEKDVIDHLLYLTQGAAGMDYQKLIVRATIEAVHSFPKQGVASTFKFGMSYGALRMALVAAKIRFEAVAPATWQRAFSLPTLKKAGSSVAKKNAHKARAQELFPSLKITHAIADALLIAEFGRRQNMQGSL